MNIETKILASLRKAREERGWSIRELARRCGYTYTHICNILNGKASPTLRVVNVVANKLGVKIEVRP